MDGCWFLIRFLSSFLRQPEGAVRLFYVCLTTLITISSQTASVFYH